MAPVLFIISLPSDDDDIEIGKESNGNVNNFTLTKEEEKTPKENQSPQTTVKITTEVEAPDDNGLLKNEETAKDDTDDAPSTEGVEEENKDKSGKIDDIQNQQDETASRLSTEQQQPASPPAVAENLKKNPASSMKRAMSFYKISKVCKNILKKFKVQKATWLKTDNGEFWQVMFQLDNKYVDNILNHLLQAGIGNNEYTSVSVVPITVNFPSMMPESEDMLQSSDIDEDTDKTEKNEFLQSVKSRLTVAQVISSVRAGSQLTFDYIMLLVLASVIAAIGLFENSSVLLVASMLVSPLMGPILGGTFGLVLQYKPVWKPAILNELLGLAVCLIMGFIFGIICGVGILPDWDIVTSEMTSRGKYRSLYVGLFIAVPSGAAVALSILGGNIGSLVGVAISASLLPPAVNAGIFWAFAIIRSIAGPMEVPIAINQTTTITNLASTAAGTAGQTLRHFEAAELAKLGAISVTLTIVNIFVIFVMGVVILKVKEVAPKTGTAVTTNFWKVDLKKTRAILHRHKEHDELVEEEVIEEWSRINNIDLKNKETLHGEKGAAVARELRGFLETYENESNEFVSRLNNQPGNRMLDQMKRKLHIPDISSRFTVAPVAYETIPLETTFVSRFTKTKLDVVDRSVRLSPSIVSINKLGQSTDTHKRSGNTPVNLPTELPGDETHKRSERPSLSSKLPIDSTGDVTFKPARSNRSSLPIKVQIDMEEDGKRDCDDLLSSTDRFSSDE